MCMLFFFYSPRTFLEALRSVLALVVIMATVYNGDFEAVMKNVSMRFFLILISLVCPMVCSYLFFRITVFAFLFFWIAQHSFLRKKKKLLLHS